MIVFEFLILTISICFVSSIPQLSPEINDQYETTNQNETSDVPTEHAATEDNNLTPDTTEHEHQIQIENINNRSGINDKSTQITKIEETSFMAKFYIAIKKPVINFIEEPRVNVILKNIGTCIVNGAMEIISYYFPAPLIPLIASAAGAFIPFEPVVMLRKRMPVTSYRRAFNKAVNSFMGTFDRFKTSEEDPYMTRRFNRRYMQDNSLQNKDDE